MSDHAEKITKALEGIKEWLGWIALWLFCIALSQCGGERVVVTGEVGVSKATVEVHESNAAFDKIHEWLNPVEEAPND